MPRTAAKPPEFAIPVASLAALRRSLTAEAGSDIAARVLQEAGRAAGEAIFAVLARREVQRAGAAESTGVGGSAAELPESVFWRRLADAFAARGWGRISHEAVHPGVGALESGDWIEADPESGALRPGCSFTIGALAALLENAAGEPVSVIEVECRSRGDLRCRFLFGGAAALSALRAEIAAGRNSDEALAALA